MNTHLFITELYTTKKNDKGIILALKDKDENNYHVYLPNREVSQIIQELAQLLSINLYTIDSKYDEEE